jgi:hypothetical protein
MFFRITSSALVKDAAAKERSFTVFLWNTTTTFVA